jgi:hypothetical protein
MHTRFHVYVGVSPSGRKSVASFGTHVRSGTSHAHGIASSTPSPRGSVQ